MTHCSSPQGFIGPSWRRRLKGIFWGVIRKHLVAELVDGFPSVYWLPHSHVVVSVYADDILAVGPKGFGGVLASTAKSR